MKFHGEFKENIANMNRTFKVKRIYFRKRFIDLSNTFGMVSVKKSKLMKEL